VSLHLHSLFLFSFHKSYADVPFFVSSYDATDADYLPRRRVGTPFLCRVAHGAPTASFSPVSAPFIHAALSAIPLHWGASLAKSAVNLRRAKGEVYMGGAQMRAR
jgi:hypothetical protein